MSMFDVKKKYGIPFNTSRKVALNRILRRIVPGGADVLDALSRVHECNIVKITKILIYSIFLKSLYQPVIL